VAVDIVEGAVEATSPAVAEVGAIAVAAVATADGKSRFQVPGVKCQELGTS
jgi:hypothetical protein